MGADLSCSDYRKGWLPERAYTTPHTYARLISYPVPERRYILVWEAGFFNNKVETLNSNVDSFGQETTFWKTEEDRHVTGSFIRPFDVIMARYCLARCIRDGKISLEQANLGLFDLNMIASILRDRRHAVPEDGVQEIQDALKEAVL